MNPYLFAILAILAARYLLELVADTLNVRHLSEELPDEFHGYYDSERYAKSQSYLRERTRFGIGADTVISALTVVVILAGGFNLADRWARSAGMGPIPTGLLFAAILVLVMTLVSLPVSIYSTFVIEEKYGFNRTTPRTFVMDQVKALLLMALIGGPVFALVLWFFSAAGSLAWLYCWIAVVAIEVLVLFIAPVVIMPLFNKFEPLEDGDLKTAIEDYARSQAFAMKGVFKMDGSKRSTKTNAFFTGFGKWRRIVLFDTLIEKHSVAELVSIVAHEMGHYKKKHIWSAMARGAAVAGLMFFLLSLFIGNRRLFDAFRMEHVSIYASLFFFGFLYTPIARVVGTIENAISRRHEYDADAFAVDTAGNPEAMIAGLKKLGVENLVNLVPHPFKVVLDYGHPPMLERIRAIREAAGAAPR